MSIFEAIKKLDVEKEAKEETIKQLQEMISKKHEYMQELKQLLEIAYEIEELEEKINKFERILDENAFGGKFINNIENIKNEIEEIKNTLRELDFDIDRRCLILATDGDGYYLAIDKYERFIVYSEGFERNFEYVVNLDEENEEIAEILYIILASSL